MPPGIQNFVVIDSGLFWERVLFHVYAVYVYRAAHVQYLGCVCQLK